MTRAWSPTNDKRLPPWYWRAVFGVMAAVALFIAGRGIAVKLSDFFVNILVALFIAFAAEPGVEALAHRGWRRGRATAAVYFAMFALVALFFGIMTSMLIDQVSGLIDDAPRLLSDGADWVNDRFGTEITTDELVSRLQEYQGQLSKLATDVGGRVVSITGSAVGVLFRLFTIMLFAFYINADGPKLRRTLCSVLEPAKQRVFLSLWDLAVQKTGGYLYSRFVLAMASGFASWVVFAILGVPSPLALALWVGMVSQFIPVIGTYLASVVPIFVALLNDPLDAVWVIVFVLVYQQVENYLLAPRVTAKTMEIHPAIAFASVLVGGALIGAAGALMALPAAAIIQAFVSAYVGRHELIDDTDLDLKDAVRADLDDGAYLGDIADLSDVVDGATSDGEGVALPDSSGPSDATD